MKCHVEDAEVVLELWHAEEAGPVVEVQAVGHAGEGGVEDCGEEGEGEFAGEVGAGFVEPVEDHFCLILFFFSFFFFRFSFGWWSWWMGSLKRGEFFTECCYTHKHTRYVVGRGSGRIGSL